MPAKHKRRRLWVDSAFQFRLLTRMAFYLLAYALVVLHISLIFEIMTRVADDGLGQGAGEFYVDFLGRHRALLITLVLTTPILLYDLLKFSHRVAGPLYRCRKIMDEMAAGKPVSEFHPRRRDLMRELIQSFNALIKEWNSRVGPGRNGQAVHVEQSNHATTPDGRTSNPSAPVGVSSTRQSLAPSTQVPSR